jgi:hypothetical protein
MAVHFYTFSAIADVMTIATEAAAEVNPRNRHLHSDHANASLLRLRGCGR